MEPILDRRRAPLSLPHQHHLPRLQRFLHMRENLHCRLTVEIPLFLQLLNHLLAPRQVSKHAQLQLGVVSNQERLPRICSECVSDLEDVPGGGRLVLEVRPSAHESTSRSIRSEGCMDSSPIAPVSEGTEDARQHPRASHAVVQCRQGSARSCCLFLPQTGPHLLECCSVLALVRVSRQRLQNLPGNFGPPFWGEEGPLPAEAGALQTQTQAPDLKGDTRGCEQFFLVAVVSFFFFCSSLTSLI
mmetsp:Transcript_11982/g.23029  ORF Transcript_11982/g.23029 Transcript_11982/m.23029 type:complete len:244 (-) Transcript_11982:434-1165(-)